MVSLENYRDERTKLLAQTKNDRRLRAEKRVRAELAITNAASDLLEEKAWTLRSRRKNEHSREWGAEVAELCVEVDASCLPAFKKNDLKDLLQRP